MQQAFPLIEIGHLMWMSSGREYYYRSTIADGDERLPYIMESIQKYQRLGKVTEYEKDYCWMHVPMNFSWSDTVWQDLQQELMEYLGIPIRFGLVPKECSCDEIGGFLLLYKEE